MEEAIPRTKPAWRWRVGALLGPSNPSLMDHALPSAVFWQRLAISMAFIGLIMAMGRARFYLPDIPVPITLQTFGVLLTGGILGWRWGLVSLLGWYFLGMAGAPVFQGGGNGWAYASNATGSSSVYVTGGFLVGFILAGALVGFLSQRGWTHSRALWPMLLGALILYLPGLLFWAAVSDSLKDSLGADLPWALHWGNVFSTGMYPFIPGDLVKLMGAALVTGALWTAADRWRRRT